MSRRLFPILTLAVAFAAPAAPRASTSAGDPRQLLHAMARAVEGVRDYTMTLISQEWSGDGMGPAEELATKWARPFKVYFKRLTEPHRGREILFADGWNSDKLKVSVHAWPINIRVNLNPHGDLAMADAKHPVDESSLIYLVNSVLDNFRRADERGEAMAEYRGHETILGRDCRRVRLFTSQSVTSYTLVRGETLWDVEKKFDASMAPLLHENRELGWTTPGDAKPGQTIRVPRYYAARIDLWIDDALALPLVAEIYDEHGAIFERFEHRDLRVNVGLGPQDFSPTNPEYKF
jgi:nucleoid-associated protein YgaU